ncbi:nucleotidyltransferase domain-containing protein [bacterium]|nr:nucleotidyltransferase domain-containing protein [bacterium]
MELYEKLGLKQDVFNILVSILEKHEGVKKAVVFGSRARGDFKKVSDIDIVLFPTDVGLKDINLIIDEIEENVNTALKFDVIDFSLLDKKELKENILKEGLVIYDRH